MFKLGITGGMGSGKSTATNFFKLKGATIFDADEESKNILLSTPSIQKKIIDSFGPNITINQKLDLIKLAEIAFLNKQNQKYLNKIMWPEVNLFLKTNIKNAEKKGANLFVVDAALLLEAGNIEPFDDILLITAPKSLRIKRISERKNIPSEQIEKRMSLQMPESKKRGLTNSIIENDGSLKKFIANLDMYYKKLNLITI